MQPAPQNQPHRGQGHAPEDDAGRGEQKGLHCVAVLEEPAGQELHEEGVTILLVEQNAARTIEVADRTYVMRSGGRIAFHGTADELAQIGDFETAYIGMGSG